MMRLGSRMILVALLIVTMVGVPHVAHAQEAPQEGFKLPSVEFGVQEAEGPGDLSLTMQLFVLVTILSLAPGIMLMMTSFTRLYIVFTFVGRALSLQGMPPGQVIASLSIFLTFFIMAPTISAVNQQAVQPYFDGEIGQITALQKASMPLREFMMKNTSRQELGFFMKTADIPKPETRRDVPFWVLLPSFMLSEIKRAFVMGVLIFIPFVVIDMVVASVLMSMGMMMLPPVMISLPFKILLFVLVDGWSLIAESVVQTYAVG
jgi:flagellar biosynthetic protein FliP